MRRAKRLRLLQQADKVYNSGQSAAAARLLHTLRRAYSGTEQTWEYAEFCTVYGAALAESGDADVAEGYFMHAAGIYFSRGMYRELANAWFNLANVAKSMVTAIDPTVKRVSVTDSVSKTGFSFGGLSGSLQVCQG